ncbi:hypothetical protein AD948_11620 [Acetobacter senegalensis]|uniref:Uncharacterized protein n=1 Tax=Acetobacter senegalensis TaxID=446692 RepID=A0A149TYV1_9PROT|nr:hypothetical protein [Acetobacter senegalensis]KXV58341.1 hypothetical protein AD948_11620 [Acetobacter senegalensis]
MIGALKARAQDIFKFGPQIFTVEIKVGLCQSVVAFGRAVAHRLFSYKSYIVVPHTTTCDDITD